ncbi:MAG: carbon-nitrogen hydrolase family protein [Planctomycetes bacterium]|nr:carbon-nitrogen hydrolase family protein [Planctomycetota bacterium]
MQSQRITEIWLVFLKASLICCTLFLGIGVASAELVPSATPRNKDAARDETVGRPVRVVSLSFVGKPVEEVLKIVDDEGGKGADIIVLPETWTGKKPLPPDSPLMRQLSELAKKHRTYIANSVYRQVGDKQFNSVILIDRQGEIVGTYDKVYPYWAEFDDLPNLAVGTEIPVFETDFGKLGFAICFDANFPELWSRLADGGAELVIWPSAYVAGSALQAHALNHHFYVVTSTWHAHNLVYDITGELLLDSSRKDLLVTRVTLDLDRRVYHENFNLPKAQQLIQDHADEVYLEKFLNLEQWFVLKAKRPGVDLLSLASKYGLEEHRDYIKRSRAEMNRRRGTAVAASSSDDDSVANQSTSLVEQP